MEKDKFLKFLGLAKKAGKLKEGYNKAEDTIKAGGSKLIIISINASLNTKDKFNTYADRFNVKVIEDFTKEELGSALGRPEINILCVTDENMSRKLLELWQEKI
ncbi:ribosomal protein HS6-type S12/L30/L7a [Clostridium pasteurianum DSM 525 = ATCC 6013]|uniref:Ribosomal protein HS6-type S12/L30/L7a n=1 Tax=Clostridium pasteurianum DSM 525 = ATCC 6013 TaxID=1262449 RepID=A0A0H3J870_CLOPA|nr:ribosomal L7Ae/L30e/S12e/Gadd45 family protein [Clostridium pasteurianum]AJA48108.1 ribosomal protein HS6-type S12/L30/L7a [Clostridium pasteurianum DSM 525 = ATCC 6013]AJA52096.1 ribosomal protein HS6-type S12/L30/L7a [Clostridium pasteurianum DSM 525 = ATCC 6013]AOZ75375.1 ribosomal protein L7Ae family protein [Clostridium pasteurianum DSM 525 = ATCC 6013]AOZ79170.1 ribosomal protein L7Ae family protein [Clostridium pasteurianum]ELP60739.1 ribosomal protein L7Ae family protein [Clostridiu